jgi:hypothetical protein
LRWRRNHFSLELQNSGNDSWLSTANEDGGGSAGYGLGDSCMRAASFILAFAFVISGSSMAGSAGGGLPGVGTFAYTGSPVAAASPLVFASR